MNNSYTKENNQIKYSKILSSMFCSTSMVILSILCLLNDLTLDLYNTINLLKIVLPASFCFWFIGFIIGKILDSYDRKIKIKQKQNEKQAYEIPSMFAMSDDTNNVENKDSDDLGVI